MHPCCQRCQAPSLTAPRVQQAPKPAVADPFAGMSAPSTAVSASEAMQKLLKAMEVATATAGQQPVISAAEIAAVPVSDAATGAASSVFEDLLVAFESHPLVVQLGVTDQTPEAKKKDAKVLHGSNCALFPGRRLED